MAAGKRSSSEVTVSYDDAPGGTPQAMGQHILEMNGVKITNALELSHAFGDSAEESTPSGMQKADDMAFTGYFDTTATTGPHVVFRPVAGDFDPNGATRSLIVVLGDSKTFTVETRLIDYEVKATVGSLTKYTATVRPTGSFTLS